LIAVVLGKKSNGEREMKLARTYSELHAIERRRHFHSPDNSLRLCKMGMLSGITKQMSEISFSSINSRRRLLRLMLSQLFQTLQVLKTFLQSESKSSTQET
jgi:hypothetical protein